MRETAEVKMYCPLGGKCLSPNAVYMGKTTSIQPNYKNKVYFGVTEKSFKDSTTTPNPLPILRNKKEQLYSKSNLQHHKKIPTIEFE